MKKTALIYLICSMVVAITVIIAVMLPIVFSDPFVPDDNESDEPIYGKLILSSASATAVYDGTALMDIEWHLVSGSLEKGHRLSVEVSGSQTNVGISENHISATVLDKNGKNVSSQYDIEYEVGLLEVKPREICIVANSDMKVYDGTPLTANGYTLDSGLSLAPDQYLDVTITGSIVEVGTADNVVEAVTIYNNKGNNVTSNYSVTSVNGKLVVYDEHALVFKSFSDAKRYDGVALTNSLWEMVSGSLLSTHKAEVKVTGSRTQPGESDNVFNVKIVDENGEDVTQYYEIVYVYGTLAVLRGEVTVSSNDAVKLYDGTPLTDAGYTISPETLQYSGLVFDVVITGEQTEIGASENTIDSVHIYDENGEDVSDYFVIITQNGLLAVVEDMSGEGSGGGLNLGGGIGLSNEPSDAVALIVTTDTEGILYLKVKSFGAYTGQSWEEATEYDRMMYSKTSAAYLTSRVLSENHVAKSYIEIISLTGEYVLPYYASDENGQTQTSDVLVSGDVFDGYSLYYYDWNFENGLKISNRFSAFETVYSKFVHGQYLDIDRQTLAYMQRIINANNWSANDPDIIEKVASYIQNAAVYSMDYDRELDKNENIAVAFLSQYKEGICQHYASAATMMFRALGIPARYTIGYAVPAKAHEETEVTGLMAHAWVEVYVEELGWVKVEVTGSSPDSEGGNVSGGGSGTGAGGGSDGSMLAPENPIDGDVVMFYLTGSTKGTVYLKMKSYGDLNDLKNGWNDAPEFGEYTSDGKTAFYLPSLALNNSGMKTSTLTIEPVFPIFVLPYYSYGGSFDLQTSDTVVSGDSTGSYEVNYFSWNGVSGPVLPSKYKSYEAQYEEYVRNTYLTVDDETRAFMQEIIAQNGFDASNPAVINSVVKYIKNAAVYNLKYDSDLDNESNVVIAFLSEYKEGVCRHYASAATLLFRSLGIPARYTEGFLGEVMAGSTTAVTADKGHAWVEIYISGIGWVNLEVTGSAPTNPAKKKLTIQPTYTGEQYNGQTITADQIVSGFEDLAKAGYRYTATIIGSRDRLGISESEIIDFKIYDSYDKLVYDRETGQGTDLFDITYQKGVVQLYIDHLIFTSDSRNKVYDGTSLDGDISDIVLISGSLRTNETYVITLSASIVNVGKISNSYQIEIYQNGVLRNDYYRIEKRYGFLEIKAREISIQAGSATKAYDGTELICNEIVYDQLQLAPGDRIETYIVEGSQTYIGEAVNIVRSVIIKNENGENVTKNYSIKTVDGILKITIP